MKKSLTKQLEEANEGIVCLQRNLQQARYEQASERRKHEHQIADEFNAGIETATRVLRGYCDSLGVMGRQHDDMFQFLVMQIRAHKRAKSPVNAGVNRSVENSVERDFAEVVRRMA
jgi:hypothetical protein